MLQKQPNITYFLNKHTTFYGSPHFSNRLAAFALASHWRLVGVLPLAAGLAAALAAALVVFSPVSPVFMRARLDGNP